MILAITSSGRKKANSTHLVLEAAKAASGGLPINHIDLAPLSFKGCTGCYGCRSGAPGCVLKDDLTPVLEEVATAQAIILGAPIYYGYVSGIMKSFMDRWYGFRDAEKRLRLPTGRPLLMILTQGHPEADAYERMSGELQKIFGAYGFMPHTMTAPGLEGPGAAEKSPALVAEATSLGTKLGALLTQNIP